MGKTVKARPAKARPAAAPRWAALKALGAISHPAGEDPRTRTSSDAGSWEMSSRDRGLATELSQGVLRYRLTLDAVLDTVLRHPISSLTENRADNLRLGLYQIMYLDRVPDHAAVSDAVTMARRIGGASFASLTNGVLRNLIRRRDAGEPLIPVVPGETDALSVRYSYPPWLVFRWLERFGREEVAAVLEGGNAPPPLMMRIIGGEDRGDVLERFRGADVPVEAGRWTERSVLLSRGAGISSVPEGFWPFLQVQDEGAQLVAELLGARPGERVLDACAAPGGKTAVFADAVGPDGEVVAIDADPDRMGILEENIGRLGLGNVRPLVRDLLGREGGRDDLGTFDRIMLDAPCTGLGVLRRHPEIKWRRQAVDLRRNGERALEMLRVLARLLRPGGTMVFAVCSTEPEEGEGVAGGFREGAPGIRPVPVAGRFATPDGFFRSWPHRDGTDGFFAARWEQTG